MNRTEVLVVGSDHFTLANIAGAFKQYESLKPETALTEEEAVEKFQQYPISMVFFTKDVSELQEKKLQRLFSFQDAAAIIVRLDGDDEQALHDAVKKAKEMKKLQNRVSFSIMDDALKNAGLNIKVQ